jgi:chromosome partitioning protein
VVDSPSALSAVAFKDVLDSADAILIPVLPSAIDIHAVSRFIADLLLRAKIKRSKGHIAVVANRARKNTLVYRKLEKFLESLGIPFIATLRDTQNYIKATEMGIGVFEMQGEALFKDHKSWREITAWLELRRIASEAAEDAAV